MINWPTLDIVGQGRGSPTHHANYPQPNQEVAEQWSSARFREFLRELRGELQPENLSLFHWSTTTLGAVDMCDC